MAQPRQSSASRRMAALLLLWLAAPGLAAQSPAPPVATQPAPPRVVPVRSPEVHPDRTVTFRLRAPQATAVELVGEVLQGQGARPMTKAEDGVWSVTIGPLPPEIWIYNFRIAGVEFPDPANISTMPRAAGTAISSFVEVPGDAALYYDARPVPHGEVRMILYESKAMGVHRYFWVYTPPGYDQSNARYPTYYLLHGNGETQSGWVANGRANIILDNLIADRKAVPMVVVMPHGHAIQSASVGPFVTVPPAPGPAGLLNFTLFSQDLREQIIPMVEKSFRVYADADHRAIGGLSMGGFQSVSIGLSHPDLFRYVLAYSGGFSVPRGNQTNAAIETTAPWLDLLAKPDQTKRNFNLIFLGAGLQETGMLDNGRRLVKMLQEQGVNAKWSEYPGGHVFSVWRNLLNETAPLLFRTKPQDRE